MTTPTSSPLITEAPKLISYLDNFKLYVIYKPAHYLTHPAAPTEIPAPDLCAWLKEQKDLPQNLKPIHRLDKETSGLILFASDPKTLADFSKLLAEGKLEKKYHCLLQGRIRDKGLIKFPLQDDRRSKPLEATTRYKALDYFGPFSYVQARPEHGRKHQIRRHFEMLGHSVVGDQRYRGKIQRKCPQAPDRLWLHAFELKLPNEQILQAPLPSELQQHLDDLKVHYAPQDAQ
jgi:23S rRNA-/tRNA-specific pseudouridylate synthase